MSRKIGKGGGAGQSGKRGSPQEMVLSPAEQDLFAEAMRGVAPLGGKGRVPQAVVSKPPRRLPALPPIKESLTTSAVGAPSARMEVLHEGECVVGRSLDVDRKLVRLLRQGDPAPQATLDLHGRRAAASHDALVRFVTNAVTTGKTCVLIIHGRGHHSASDGPVLKSLVVEVLSSAELQPLVLAFASAPRSLGGQGATLVRLRRAR